MNRVFPAVSFATCRAFALRLSLFALLVLTLAGSLPAFAAEGSLSPTEAVESYFKAIAENRAEEVVALCSFKEIPEEILEGLKSAIASDFTTYGYERMQKNGGLRAVKASLVRENGDKVKVRFELEYGDDSSETDEMNLINDEGWKVDLGDFDLGDSD